MNREQLPFLLNLIDDDTDEVRGQVIKELSDYGPALEEDLNDLSKYFDSHKLSLINPILVSNRRKWLEQNWKNNIAEEDEYDRLEIALQMIINFQYGFKSSNSLETLLDGLTKEFHDTFFFGNEIDLANFLFKEKGLKGVKEDYYNPLNSNLEYVIKQKKGIPISLVLVYMLIGVRLGFKIEGCNFPGHFLAKILVDGEQVLVDCFNDGKLIFESDLYQISEESIEAVMHIVNSYTHSGTIIRRVVTNLINAYNQLDEKENSDLFNKLLDMTPH
jgi:hypothetical protein